MYFIGSEADLWGRQYLMLHGLWRNVLMSHRSRQVMSHSLWSYPLMLHELRSNIKQNLTPSLINDIPFNPFYIIKQLLTCFCEVLLNSIHIDLRFASVNMNRSILFWVCSITLHLNKNQQLYNVTNSHVLRLFVCFFVLGFYAIATVFQSYNSDQLS